MSRSRSNWKCLTIAATASALSGCVQRTISITSEPPGALVWLNDREVGRTPLDVGFLHYGTYDVRLALDGYEPLMTRGDAMPPWWDHVGPDFFAEMVPGAKSDISWHYQLTPADDDAAKLLERAQVLRQRALEGAAVLSEAKPQTPLDGSQTEPTAENPGDPTDAPAAAPQR